MVGASWYQEFYQGNEQKSFLKYYFKEGVPWIYDTPSLKYYTSFLFFSSQPSNCMKPLYIIRCRAANLPYI